MRRVLLYAVGVLSISLGLGVPATGVLAMNTTSANSNTCSETSFPAPYTGGAGVAKFFHLSDGSTVTITNTGAVIKEGRCGTPYREGWINTSDICNINSAQDLNGHLSSGSSNPTGSGTFTGCHASSQSSGGQQASGSVTIVNNNSQSQSQAQAQSVLGTQTAASASSNPNNGTSAQAQVQTPATTTTTTAPAATVKTLPDTGPGNILALSGATTAIGTLGHIFYTRRRRH
jgi:hypothetical protein